MRQIHTSAWLLVLLSAVLQILIFPLPNVYVLCWVAFVPLLMALLRGRVPDTLQLREGIKLLPVRPFQGFLLAYVCGILWYAGSCYWIFNTMRDYGGLNAASALGVLILFCLYLGLYHGLFGIVVSLLAEEGSFSRRAVVLSAFAWVAVELARTRITGFPWDLLGICQVDNIPLSLIARVTGVYGISFEIMLVNAAIAGAFLIRRDRRRSLLLAGIAAAVILQAGWFIRPPAAEADQTARLVQANIPIFEGGEWTKPYFESTLQDLTALSLGPGKGQQPKPALIAWPENPAPFYTSDPLFRDALSNLARQAHTWVIAGAIGTENATMTPGHASQIHNSAVLVNPEGEWLGQYDKVHLVPFGEYVPFKQVFGFAGGLTEAVGDFSAGTSREPLRADGSALGVFICYESIFPDEVRQFARNGANVFLNLSNDGWYGDSGAYAQHLKQTRMRSVENDRWTLLDTNTGVTASIDPDGRIVASVRRKVRTLLTAPYATSSVTTFYTRHGDWFAYLCAIISLGGLAFRLPFLRRKN